MDHDLFARGQAGAWDGLRESKQVAIMLMWPEAHRPAHSQRLGLVASVILPIPAEGTLPRSLVSREFTLSPLKPFLALLRLAICHLAIFAFAL